MTPYLVGLEERKSMARTLPVEEPRTKITIDLSVDFAIDLSKSPPAFKTCIDPRPTSLSRKQDQNSDTRLHRFVRGWASSCRVFLGGLPAPSLAFFASFQTCREVSNTRFIPRAKMKSLYVYPMGIHIYLTRS